MTILVVTASKHGATEEIGQIIAQELTEAGLQATHVPTRDVEEAQVKDAKAIVLGSAVYMNQWMEGARSFASRFADDLTRLPSWAFSVGLNGVPTEDVRAPERAAKVVESFDPISYTVFAGRLTPADLSLRERSVARMAHAPEGDYRDMDKVREFARQIAREYNEHMGS